MSGVNCCDCKRTDLPAGVGGYSIGPAHADKYGKPCLEGTIDRLDEPTPVWLCKFTAERQHETVEQWRERNFSDLLVSAENW